MRNAWILPGSEENWRQALMSKGIWGLEERTVDKIYWLALTPNDIVLFYISGKIKGIVGYGVIRSKFYQNTPLWKAEIAEGRAKWPLRFEFDIEFILPENEWKNSKIPLPGGAIFRQPIIFKDLREIEVHIKALNPKVSKDFFSEDLSAHISDIGEVPSPNHEYIQNMLLEIGKLQSYIANSEYLMGTERLDVVWRRLPESVPTYVFEVQIGGDLYHALGKLKHAHDIWNSRIFLVASTEGLGTVNKLISGTFHEIQPLLHFINIDKIQSLHKAKINIYQIEKELGIIP